MYIHTGDRNAAEPLREEFQPEAAPFIQQNLAGMCLNPKP
jgi:hypothetical protein